ncbi:hypothetical protein [Bradyrhizobium cenepequi]
MVNLTQGQFGISEVQAFASDQLAHDEQYVKGAFDNPGLIKRTARDLSLIRECRPLFILDSLEANVSSLNKVRSNPVRVEYDLVQISENIV